MANSDNRRFVNRQNETSQETSSAVWWQKEKAINHLLYNLVVSWIEASFVSQRAGKLQPPPHICRTRASLVNFQVASACGPGADRPISLAMAAASSNEIVANT